MKELLKMFHLNGNTIGFRPQTQNLELQVLLKMIHLNGNTIGFRPQTQKLELHTK